MSEPRPAPPGFSEAQWHGLERDGYLILPGALSPDEVRGYAGAIRRLADADVQRTPGTYWGPQNLVERDPALEDLIDRPTHVGYAYDLYGEQTKLHLSQAMLRPRGGGYNQWHFDGPRAVPYQDHVKLHRRCRLTWLERRRSAEAGAAS